MNKELASKSWFESWFDSPFYHKLYNNRNFLEAELFIKNLVSYLKLKPKQKVLDLACGKGRHAYFLSQFGLDVLGLDLSENSIKEAQKFSNKNLRFEVHDMRKVYDNQTFDVILNLFTSFGYFENEEENLRVLNSIYSMLNPKGILVIDFMNSLKIIKELVSNEKKSIEGTDFYIERSYDKKHIFKYISFEDQGQKYNYIERVQALKKDDFQQLFRKSGFKIIHTFGDYMLNDFNINNSPRLILIAIKK